MKMAIIKKKALKEMSNDDIHKRITELRLELAKEKAQIIVGGSPTSTGRVSQIRKTIAKLLTEDKIRKTRIVKPKGGESTGRSM